MDLDKCANTAYATWHPKEIAFYDRCGRFFLNEYQFMRRMLGWEFDDEGWVLSPISDLRGTQGNAIIVEFSVRDRYDHQFAVIPYNVRNISSYLGPLLFKSVKRFKFLHNPIKNNIIFQSKPSEEYHFDKQLLCLITSLGELPTIMEVFRSLSKNESDTITFSDIPWKILPSVLTMSIKHSSLSQLLKTQFPDMLKRIDNHS